MFKNMTHAKSFLPRYGIGLFMQIKSRDFIFDCIDLMYYKCLEMC